MDYSKVPFRIADDQKIFPGKVNYLLYPAAAEEKSVLIHPVCFSILEQTADSVFKRDFREQNLLFYCLKGDGGFIYRGKTFSFCKGMGFFLEGDALSEISAGAEGGCYTLYTMTGALSEELQRISERQNTFTFDADRFHDFEQRQFLLVKSFPGRLYGKEYDFSCHMDHLLVRILELKPAVSRSDHDDRRRMIQQVITYMHAHLSDDINVNHLAAQFHYSASQFQKCFREQAFSSPKQYLIRIRMQEAENLLLNTDLSIEEICTRCGFHNANHFILVFRQYSGKTPLQYRKGRTSITDEKRQS